MQTSKGDIELELYADKAPVTVANFIDYVKAGFFDGTVFHRVIPGFMIQGGGFTEDMKQKETNDQIKNEADNGLKNDNGTIAMARTSDPNSATAQFFLNVKDNDFLNYSAATMQGWGYCVFGKVTKGLEIVQLIEQVKTATIHGHQNVPVDAIVIRKVTLVED
ncbi:MAG: peptidylprolyl isomerase [Gammaproteobacteria bacterium]